jgi:Predicted redox protein, regulator of disulfide bond formation
MKEVDARGLSCPEPVMLVVDALNEGATPIRVLVSEAHHKMNVEKCAKDAGKTVMSTETKDGFEIVIE